jgi:hypothetical protein
MVVRTLPGILFMMGRNKILSASGGVAFLHGLRRKRSTALKKVIPSPGLHQSAGLAAARASLNGAETDGKSLGRCPARVFLLVLFDNRGGRIGGAGRQCGNLVAGALKRHLI